MKSILFALIIFLSPLAPFAQTPINKTVSVKSGQQVELHFDFPELIKITTWDRNEVSIEGSVSINGGEHDDAFQLVISNEGKAVTIKNKIINMKNLPQRVTVFDGAEKIIFKNKEEYTKYQQQQGKRFTRVSYGLDMDIILEIKIPANTSTTVESIYGMVEVWNFDGPLAVKATYGGVDVAVNEQGVGQITAETNHGEIYSNLDAKFDGRSSADDHFHTLVSATPGRGPAYTLDSRFGNVYLRKAQ
jgi:hypothetical protein